MVSWLIPVRDGGRWLADAAGSALAQCGPGDELVVVDDGSREDPGPLLPADPRVRLLYQPPLGIASALERGRAACRGRYVARLDADDLALPGRLAAQVAALEADPALGAVGGRARIGRDDGPVPGGMLAYVEWVNGLRDPHPQLLVESPLFHPAVTFRASAVAAVGGYRGGDFPEDYALWLDLAAAGWRLKNLDREVVWLRDREDRLTRSDPRYRREAFRRLKMDWLARTRLAGAPLTPRRVGVWGAGRGGRPWIRWLVARGCAVQVFDLKHGGRRQGLPIQPAGAVEGAALDLLLVAVGARGARALIRAQLARWRPEWAEGRDWLAVA